MAKTPQPNLVFFFFFFFTLHIATQTTGSVKCKTGSLHYPFGFSNGYPIRLNCSKVTGDAEIGEFAVEEVTNSNIYVKIPSVCKRKIGKIEQLFRENLAPSNFNNTFIVQGCKEQLSNCSTSIPNKFVEDRLNLSSCNIPVSCLDGATTTADVLSIGDVVNRSGCTYWFSSITKSEYSVSLGRLKLDWWLKEGCSNNTTCSENADCTEVSLADGGFGHRCTCREGFSGEAFTVPGGCRQLGKGDRTRSFQKGIRIALSVSLSPFLVLLLVYILNKYYDRGQQNLKPLEPKPNLKLLIPLKQYSYEQVERITKSFAKVVGRGGFGTVYRGTFSDGRMVAVKVLKKSKGNDGEDFVNEVASMSQTSHVNIVTLLGFCSEGYKRAIIYEFMENGSLDKFISSKSSLKMDRTSLYRIALGVARGLEYLHHGCRTRIVHFDIKPQNVLLDENLCPKVADFGLAKLCEKKESILSLLDTRGTIGYMAPELFSRMYGRVSHKSDVYSYGMLVLEMIGARNKERADQNSASDASSMYFPEWIYKDLEKGDDVRLIRNEISSEEEEIERKMKLVGLWCIQSSPLDRPPMNKVVEMMEGSVDALEIPPRSVLQQIPSSTLQESSTFSEDISDYVEKYSINVA